MIENAMQKFQRLTLEELRGYPSGDPDVAEFTARIRTSERAVGGVKNRPGRLTEGAVQWIRARKPYLSATEMAAVLGVDVRTIYRVWQGISYAHVESRDLPMPDSIPDHLGDWQQDASRHI